MNGKTMQMNGRRTGSRRAHVLLAAMMAFLGAAQPVHAQEPPLKLDVITGNEGNLYANFTLVMGKTEAILIDAPFTQSEAHRLVGRILESGRTLRTIYITHDHPDHFFSVDVIAQAFPDAQIVSAPAVVDDIWRSIPLKVRRWGPLLGTNGPKHPFAPTALNGDHLELDGQRLDILGPIQGDHVHATAIYIPSIGALIAGDLVFNKIHLWLGEATPEARKAWLASIDRLIALHPKIVVAGHKLPGLPDDASALAFTRDYLVAFEAAAANSKTSKDLMARIKARFPDTQDVLNNFILSNSAQVATGEAAPWTE
jgi:glyoxylase-like metal-dependent hydrolase (beta-lactamase superfamily II)